MQTGNYKAIEAIVAADSTVTVEQRAEILAAARGCRKSESKEAKPAVRILKRAEVAHRLGISPRGVDKLAAEGTLKKFRLSGRSRALGISSIELDKLLAG